MCLYILLKVGEGSTAAEALAAESCCGSVFTHSLSPIILLTSYIFHSYICIPMFYLTQLPEKLSQLMYTNTESFSVVSYTEGETLHITNLKDSVELEIASDLATSFSWRKLHQENINITRLKGELSLNCGKVKLFPEIGQVVAPPDQKPVIHWGQPDLEKLLNVLSKMGIEGSLEREMSDAESKNVHVIRIHDPMEAMIEVQESRTIISVADKTLSARIFDALDNVLDGV